MTQLSTLTIAATLLLSQGAAFADKPAYTFTQIGATYIEAPPNRDRNLMPMGVFGSGEKVETSVVVGFKNRLIVDAPTFGRDAAVTATGIRQDKSQVSLGSADYSNMRRVSDDRRQTLITLAVKRLPDTPLAAVSFGGTVTMSVARSVKSQTLPFQAKVGAQITAGAINARITKVEPNAFVLTSNAPLTALASVKLLPGSGGPLMGELTGYSTEGSAQGTVATAQWQFKQPIPPTARIELGVFEGLEAVELPISFIVMRPY